MKKLSTKSSIRAAVFAVMGLTAAGVAMAAAGTGPQSLTITLNVPVGTAPNDFDATFVPVAGNAPTHPSAGWGHTATLNAPTTAPGAAFAVGGNVAIYSQNNTLTGVDMYLAGNAQPTITFGTETPSVVVTASQQFTQGNYQTGLAASSQVLPFGAGTGQFQLPNNTSMVAGTTAYDYLQIAGTVPTDATQAGTGTVVVTVVGTWN